MNKQICLTINGLVPLTTIDFPDNLSAVIFCQGCPFRCPYCHNPSLIPKTKTGLYSWDKIQNFLLSRIGLLDAVVFSGGEPTLQGGLLDAIKEVKALGFKVGLHTAGSYPQKLQKILPYIDWVGMDIKAPFEDYATITKVPNSGERALVSAKLILASKISYEFRTTVHPKLLSNTQILQIKTALQDLGVVNYKIQEFRQAGCLDPSL